MAFVIESYKSHRNHLTESDYRVQLELNMNAIL